jgi:hypothetical protein
MTVEYGQGMQAGSLVAEENVVEVGAVDDWESLRCSGCWGVHQLEVGSWVAAGKGALDKGDHP